MTPLCAHDTLQNQFKLIHIRSVGLTFGTALYMPIKPFLFLCFQRTVEGGLNKKPRFGM